MKNETEYINSILLEKLKVMAQHRLSGEMLNSLNIEQIQDIALNDMIYNISTSVIGEKLFEYTYPVKDPKTWIDYIKKGIIKRLPFLGKIITVNYKTRAVHKVRKYNVYPKLPITFPVQSKFNTFTYIENDNYWNR